MDLINRLSVFIESYGYPLVVSAGPLSASFLVRGGDGYQYQIERHEVAGSLDKAAPTEALIMCRLADLLIRRMQLDDPELSELRRVAAFAVGELMAGLEEFK